MFTCNLVTCKCTGLQKCKIKGNSVNMKGIIVYDLRAENWNSVAPIPEQVRSTTIVLFWPKIIEELQSFQIRGNLIRKSN